MTPVALTQPANVFSTIDAERTVLQGTSGPGAKITIRGPGDELYNTIANEDGEWSQEVNLARGSNTFSITATDAVTNRESATLQVTINRPLPAQTAAPTNATASQAPVELTLTLSGPSDGSISTDGNVIVRGATTGSRITVESEYLGQPGATPGPPGSPAPEASPTPAPTRTPRGGGQASPAPIPTTSPPPIGPGLDITVPDTGSFSETMNFPIGRWQLKVTAYGIGVAPISETRTISVEPPFSNGINLVITVTGRDSWVRARADGGRVNGLGTLHDGEVRTLSAISELCVRTGNASALNLNLNGLDIGFLGAAGEVGSWIFLPGQGPEPTEDPC